MNVAFDPAEYRAALRSDFYSFMLRCFTDLNAGAAYMPSCTSKSWRRSCRACGMVTRDG